jgi:beta-glucanase (GH16 family)
MIANRIVLAFLMLSGISVIGQEWKLVWEDDFNGNEINTENWNFEIGDGCPERCGWGNNEKQVYTKENHKVEDGLLTITARTDGKAYTSAKITTQNKRQFRYGRIEARLKLPLGKGVWPAFWMLGQNIDQVGWPLCGEIDIMEYVGREPNTLFTTLHTADSHGNSKNTRKAEVPGIEEGFHVYACEWTDSRISFFVDDRHFYTFEPEQRTEEIWPFDQPFYIVLNLAVGGNFGGSEVDNSMFPANYVVDYVKVYEAD